MKAAHLFFFVATGTFLTRCSSQDKPQTTESDSLSVVNKIEPHATQLGRSLEEFINSVPELPFPYHLELQEKLDISKYKRVDSLTFWTYLEPQESLSKIPEQRPRNYFVFGRITYSTLHTGVVYGYLVGDQQVLSIAVFENRQRKTGHLFEFWASYLLDSPASVSVSTVDGDGAVNVSVWELKQGEKWSREYQQQNSPTFNKSYFLELGNYESLEKSESNQYDG